MVIDFLKKLRSEYLEQKMELESEQKSIEIKLKKNSKFIQKLREEDEQKFDAFSPRKYNLDLKNSIKDLENEQNLLLKKLEDINRDLDYLACRFVELDDVLKEEKKKCNDIKMEEESTWTESIDLEVLKDLRHRLEFSFQLSQIDPNRCKLELSSALKILNKLIAGM